jgi:hypothetical protein
VKEFELASKAMGEEAAEMIWSWFSLPKGNQWTALNWTGLSPAQAIAVSIDRTMNHPVPAGQLFLKYFQALPHPPRRGGSAHAPASA